MSEDEATHILLGNLDGEPLGDPRVVRYVAGRRHNFWDRNCVAVGLASGFLEPLESTSILLIQTAISRIIPFFPHTGFEAADITVYNAQTQFEVERIRDFIILHYHATKRNDSPFWDCCRTMEVPATLQHKIDLFSSNGRLCREANELFADLSWLQVMHGQRIRPRGYHPFADLRPAAEVDVFPANVEGVIAKCVQVMPTQAEFMAAHCSAKPQS